MEVVKGLKTWKPRGVWCYTDCPSWCMAAHGAASWRERAQEEQRWDEVKGGESDWCGPELKPR